MRWIIAAVLVLGFSAAGSCDDRALGQGVVEWAPPCIGKAQRVCVDVDARVLVKVSGGAVTSSMSAQRVSKRRALALRNEWKRRFCEPLPEGAGNPDDRVCTHWKIIK